MNWDDNCALFVSCFLGLSMTWCLSTGTFLIIAFSYIKILVASVKQNRADRGVNRKALQTCASHLVVYVLYELATLILVVIQRFPSVSVNLKKFVSILFIIIPPTINPIIYGLVSKELRVSVIKHFTIKFCHKKLHFFRLLYY